MTKKISLLGFTMIELLVVIAVLGILAAALIATVDPIEQVKKSRDTTLRSATIDVSNALTRYYASQGDYPWTVDAAGCGSGNFAPNGTSIANMPDTCIADLVNAGELKEGFKTNLRNAGKLYVTVAADPSRIIVCFNPDSKAIRSEPQTIFDSKGVDITQSGPCPGNAACHWCVR